MVPGKRSRWTEEAASHNGLNCILQRGGRQRPLLLQGEYWTSQTKDELEVKVKKKKSKAKCRQLHRNAAGLDCSMTSLLLNHQQMGEEQCSTHTVTTHWVELKKKHTFQLCPCNALLWRSKVSNELKRWGGRVATSTMCLTMIQWIVFQETYSCESIVCVGAHSIYFILCKSVCVGQPGHLECMWAADHWHFLRCQDADYVYFGPSFV